MIKRLCSHHTSRPKLSVSFSSQKDPQQITCSTESKHDFSTDLSLSGCNLTGADPLQHTTAGKRQHGRNEKQYMPDDLPGRILRFRRATIGCRLPACSSDGPPRAILRALPTGLACLERAMVPRLVEWLIVASRSALRRVLVRSLSKTSERSTRDQKRA